MRAVSKYEEGVYRFDAFELDPLRRTLSRAGEIIPLKPKVFDTLLVLVKNSGRVLGKDDLMGEVWPDAVVEEVNLAHNISLLRKALGQKAGETGFILTLPGRGYRFVADVTEIRPDDGQPNGAATFEYERTRSRLVIEETGAGEAGSPALASDPDEAIARRQAAALPGGGAAQASGRRRSGIALILAGLFCVLAAGGLVYWLGSRDRARSMSGSPDAAPQVTIRQLTTKGQVSLAVLSPDGKFYAYTLAERGEPKYSLWLGQIGGSNEIQLRPPEDLFYNGLAFSGDGKTLYFSTSPYFATPSALYRMPVLGGVPEKILSDVGYFISLSPDDKQIALFRT